MTRKTWEDRGSSHARGYGWTWQKRRAAWLLAHPLCAICQANGRVTAASELDHIKPKAHGGSDRDDNLQALCAECHATKSMHDRGQLPRRTIGVDGYPVDAGGE